MIMTKCPKHPKYTGRRAPRSTCWRCSDIYFYGTWEESGQPATGIKGYLLYSPITHKHFFRVYHEKDRSKFLDYDLAAEDIEVVLADRFTVLHSNTGRLDYTDHVLGRDYDVKAQLQTKGDRQKRNPRRKGQVLR